MYGSSNGCNTLISHNSLTLKPQEYNNSIIVESLKLSAVSVGITLIIFLISSKVNTRGSFFFDLGARILLLASRATTTEHKNILKYEPDA